MPFVVLPKFNLPDPYFVTRLNQTSKQSDGSPWKTFCKTLEEMCPFECLLSFFVNSPTVTVSVWELQSGWLQWHHGSKLTAGPVWSTQTGPKRQAWGRARPTYSLCHSQQSGCFLIIRWFPICWWRGDIKSDCRIYISSWWNFNSYSG